MRFPTLLLFSFVAIVGRSQVSVTFSEIEKESVKGIRCYNIVLEAQGSNPILLLVKIIGYTIILMVF
ncbi:MAG: hypothetical protein IPO48_13680 [Saprospiraceae bacterium]|nr:hypothetical protein [Saprospiraceae bacterium]